MESGEIPVPNEEFDSTDAVVAFFVLRKLPEYTQAQRETESEASWTFLHRSVCAARWYYRRDSKCCKFVALLNAYIDAFERDEHVLTMDKATEIAEQCDFLNAPRLNRKLPPSLVISSVVTLALSIAVVGLIAGTGDWAGDSAVYNRRTAIASLVLSVVTVLSVPLLLGAIAFALVSQAHTIQERVVTRALTALDGSKVECGEVLNPLADFSQDSAGNVADHSEAFLMDADVAHRRRRDIVKLLMDATEDAGTVVLQSRAGPPVAVSLRGFYRHTIVIMTDYDGQVVMWSDGAAACLGFSARDAEGSNINALLCGEKSIEEYAKRTAAAAKDLDLSEATLTLAHMRLGSVSIKATVVLSRNAETHAGVGYTLIGSVRSDELSLTQALFHSYCVAELNQLNVNDTQFRQIVHWMPWNNLRDAAASARGWKSARVRRLLAQVVKDRRKTVDVEVDPKLAEMPPISCDVGKITAVLNDACDLFTEKIRIRAEQKRVTSAMYQLIVTLSHGLPEIPKESVGKMMDEVNSGGGVLINAPGSLKLLLPFMVGDEGLQGPSEEAVTQAPSGHDPLIVLLLEKNALYRHNISNAILQNRHFLRQVLNVEDALHAIEDSTDIGCAIIDGEMRGSERVVSALRAKQIFTIVTAEESDGAAKGGDAVLKMPLVEKDLAEELKRATAKVDDAKQAGELVTKQREIFSTVRKTPWKQGRVLGSGAFATVYEATADMTGGKMAVKKIRLQRNFEENVNQLMNEIEILCKLTHPNIIHYFYCERSQSTLDLFMELADQGTLADLLSRRPHLPENHVATITKQLLQAVNYLHENGIVHRDIKPGNILISQGKLKLSDFGTATTSFTADEGPVGTLTYMAPEVVDGKSSGKASDIWSIGCVVCECLGVKRPGGGLLGYGAPVEFPAGVSQRAIDFIKACMHENLAERSTTGSLLLHEFIVLLEHEVAQLAEVPLEAIADEEGHSPAGDGAETGEDSLSWV